MRKSAGFTLMELMVTLVLAGVFLTIATPQLNDFNKDIQIRRAASNFQSLLQVARTEAITRNARVYLFNPDGSDNWSGSFQICQDEGGVNDGCDQDEAEFVREANTGQTNTEILSNLDGQGIIFFNARGRLENAEVQLAFCDSRGTAGRARFMTINATGRPFVEEFDDTNGAHVCDP